MPSSDYQPPISRDRGDLMYRTGAAPDSGPMAEETVEEELVPSAPWLPPPLLTSTLATLRHQSGAQAACVWMETVGGLSLIAADPPDMPLGEVVPHPGGAVLDVLDRGAIHLVRVGESDPALPALPMLHDWLGAHTVAVLPIRPIGEDPPAAVCLYLQAPPDEPQRVLFEWGRWARNLVSVLPRADDADFSSESLPAQGLVEDTPENVRAITRELARRLAAQLATVEAALGEAQRTIEAEEPSSRFFLHALEGLDRTREMLARLELFADDRMPVSEPVSVADCTHLAVRRLESERPERVRLQTMSPPALPPVAADRVQLTSAIEEVVRNALEAAPAGTDVTVRAERSGGWICVEVADQGAGMTREQIERAVLPFHTTRSRASHAGLGLTTAEGILRRHGGRMSVTSQVGRGTTVRLWLPAG